MEGPATLRMLTISYYIWYTLHETHGHQCTGSGVVVYHLVSSSNQEGIALKMLNIIIITTLRASEVF